MTYTPFHAHDAPAHPAPIARKTALSGTTAVILVVALVLIVCGAILLVKQMV
jgi:hypothetical protein